MAKLEALFRFPATMLAAAALACSFLLTILLQDNIAQSLIKPSDPFQVQLPPVAPSYGGRGAWAVWPGSDAGGEADIFYIHSTTYDRRDRWNAPVGDKRADETLKRIAIPNEAGPFLQVGPVYGPRYRQATLFAEFTHKFDGLAAHELAFEDVKTAFAYFLHARHRERPFILVGYGQGGLHALGLLQTVIGADPAAKNALAAAYLIDVPVPAGLHDASGAPIRACADETETGCLIAYIASPPSLRRERSRYRSRALIWGADGRLISVSRLPLICTNPLDWRIGSEGGAEAHRGAASATGLKPGDQPPPIKGAVSAACVGGLLQTSAPQQNFLRQAAWFGRQWRPEPFNLFYFDLAADAERRARRHADLVKQTAADHKNAADSKK